MAGSLDDLIERLLSDVALSGSQGIGAEQFETAVKAFYQEHYAVDASPGESNDLLFSAAPSNARLNVDNAFILSIFDWLSKHADIEIRVFQDDNEQAGVAAPDQPIAGNAQHQTSNESTTVTLRERLQGKRICTTEERVWLAVAGHGVDHQRVPAKEFELLSAIAACGPQGILQPSLFRITGQDKRSVPHRTDCLAQKGYITKESVIGSRARTSLLKLKKYAQISASTSSDTVRPVGGDIAPDTVIFYDKWFNETIRLLKENGNIISMTDLRIGLGIHQKHWETKALIRCIRRLGDRGCIRRLTARMHDAEGKVLKRFSTGQDRKVKAIQLIREPTDMDRRFWTHTAPQLKLAGMASTENTEDVAGEEDAADSDDDGQLLNLSQGTASVDLAAQRIPPQWTPDIPYMNLIFNIVDRAGPAGLSSMDLSEIATGPGWKRPLDDVMAKLTDDWRFSQPSHLRHLTVIRDTAVLNKAAHYQYRSLAQYEKAVAAGDVIWDAVADDLGAKPGGPGKRRWSPPRLDDWGFPQLQPRDFAGGDGRATLSDAMYHGLRYAQTESQQRRERLEQSNNAAPHRDSPPGPLFKTRRGRKRKSQGETLMAKKKRKTEEKERKEFERTALRIAQRMVLAEMNAGDASANSAVNVRLSATARTQSQKMLSIKNLPADRVQQAKEKIMARKSPGIYVNPPGARAMKIASAPYQGRPRNALILVIKTDQLRQLSWFVDEQDLESRLDHYALDTMDYSARFEDYSESEAETGAVPGTMTSENRYLDSQNANDNDEGNPEIDQLVASVDDQTRANRTRPVDFTESPIRDAMALPMDKGSLATARSEDTGHPPMNGLASEPTSMLSRQPDLPEGPSGPLISEEAQQSDLNELLLLSERLSAFRSRRGRRSKQTLEEMAQLEKRIKELQANDAEHSTSAAHQARPFDRSTKRTTLSSKPHELQKDSESAHEVGRPPKMTSGRKLARPQLTVKLPVSKSAHGLSSGAGNTAPGGYQSDQRRQKSMSDGDMETLVHAQLQGRDANKATSKRRVTFAASPTAAVRTSDVSNAGTEIGIPGSNECSPRPTTSSSQDKSQSPSSLRGRTHRGALHRRASQKVSTKSQQPLGPAQTFLDVLNAARKPSADATVDSQDQNSSQSVNQTEPVMTEVDPALPTQPDDQMDIDVPEFTTASEARDPFLRPTSALDSSPSKRTKKSGTRRAGGSVAAQRAMIIFEAIRQCNGVFPGNTELWYVVVTAWQKKFNQTPDRHTVERAIANLVANGSLKKFTFQFKTKKGLVQTRSIVAEPGVDPQSPAFRAMQKNIKDTWPGQYLPPDVDVSDQLRQQAVTILGKRKSQQATSITPEGASKSEKRMKMNNVFPEDERAMVRQTDFSLDYSEEEARTLGFQDAEAYRQYRIRRSAAFQRMWQPNNTTTSPEKSDDAEDGAERSITRTGGTRIARRTLTRVNQNSPVRITDLAGPRRPLSTLRFNALTSRGIRKPRQHIEAAAPYFASLKAHSQLDPQWLQRIQAASPATARARRRWWDVERITVLDSHNVLRDRAMLMMMKPHQTFSTVTGTFGTHSPLFGTESKLSSEEEKTKARPALTEPQPFTPVAPKSLEELLGRASSLGYAAAGTSAPWPERFKRDVDRVQAWEMEMESMGRSTEREGKAWPFINHVIEGAFHDVARKVQLQPPPIRAVPHLVRLAPALAPGQNVPAAAQRAARAAPENKPRRPYQRRSKHVTFAQIGEASNTEVAQGQDGTALTDSRRAWAVRDRVGAAAFKDIDRLVIAYALTSLICGGINQTRLSWNLIAHAFGYRHDGEFLRRRWAFHRKFRMPDVLRLLNAMREPFLKAYEDGELPRIDFQDLESTDWARLFDWVEHEVLPLDEGDEPLVPDLPQSRAALAESYEIIERRNAYEPSRDDFFTGITDQGRRHVALRYCYGNTLPGECKPSQVSNERDVLIKSWVRAVVTTKQWNYNGAAAAQKISVFSDKEIERISKEMVDTRVFTQDKKGRQLPGRNFQIHNDVLMQFRRWPGRQDEFKYMRLVAEARTRIVHFFETHDEMSLIPTASDPQYLVLTNMVAQGLLTIKVVLPPRNDAMDAPFPKISPWSYSGYNYETKKFNVGHLKFPIIHAKTAAYTADHGLRPQVPIPLAPPYVPGEAGLRIPFWVDIHGNVMEDVWDMVLRSVLHLLVFRAGYSAQMIAAAHNDKLGAWEIALVLGWLGAVGLAERCGDGVQQQQQQQQHQQDGGDAGAWSGGWRAAGFWYCAFLPEIARWKPPAGVELSVNTV